MRRPAIAVFLLVVAACDGDAPRGASDAQALTDARAPTDGGLGDAAAVLDAAVVDANDPDAVTAPPDGSVPPDGSTVPPDGSTVPLDAGLDAPIDAPPPTPPIVTGIGVPDDPAGTIPLAIAVRDLTSPTVSLLLRFACDGATTWTDATILDDLTDLPVDAAGVVHTVRWDSLADVAFHTPHDCLMAVVATDPGGLSSETLVARVALDHNLRAAARRVDDYLIHYGPWSTALVDTLRRYQLVILDPRNAGLTRARVEVLQRGVDPAIPADDVIVLCYISVGEDIRTASKTDAELLADPRFAGDRTGPRVDPRGPAMSGQSLDGLDPLGLPSPGGAGYASFYLDDNDVLRTGVGDGRPDRNAYFGGAFVNAGDPAWYDALEAMTIDGPDHVAGLDEILTDFAGRGLGCDGVFLDTYDTAAPNAYTDLTSGNLSQFEWTAPGLRLFTERLRASYPDKILLQNRGLFFFDPRHRQYRFNTGGLIDFSLFESFRLDSASDHDFYPTYHADNRFNVAPKLMAEANRGRGFRVLSLGYAEGPADQLSEATLTGGSTLGLASLLEDIRVAQDLTGFRHYLSNSSLTHTNTFVMDRASLIDVSPPQWTSTYNDHNFGWPTPAEAPTPRVGVQQVVAGPGKLVIRWDVALDLHRVRYVAYYQPTPFDFAADPTLAGATRVVLSPRAGAGYLDGVGPGRLPYEADLVALAPGTTYHVVIRALDDSPAANEDRNTHVLTGVPMMP